MLMIVCLVVVLLIVRVVLVFLIGGRILCVCVVGVGFWGGLEVRGWFWFCLVVWLVGVICVVVWLEIGVVCLCLGFGLLVW